MPHRAKSLVIAPKRQAFLMRAASIAAILTATLLVCIKLVFWWLSGSLSMLSTLVDSCLDVGVSLVNFFAVRAALIPADREHRFGHGKAEGLAALGQAAFIIASSIFLVYAAIGRLHEPVPVTHEVPSMIALLIAIVFTACLVSFQGYVVKSTGSLAIAADSAHYKTDILVNTTVMAALIIEWKSGALWVDPLFGCFIALYVLWCSRKIVTMALDVLLDREINETDRDRIAAIIEAEPQSRGYHDMRTRAAGPNYFIQFHLELDSHLTLAEAHEITDRIEQQIIKVFPLAHVSIHQEPAGIIDARDNFI